MPTSHPKSENSELVFEPFKRPDDWCIQPNDAKFIGELSSTYISEYADNISGVDIREKLVITTPNADYLPSINLENQVVAMCEDGRFGQEDWVQWPQWYCESHDHFPYILKRPEREILVLHPLRWLWWDMTESDFIPADGEDISRCGFLTPTVANELYNIRNKLMEEVRLTTWCTDEEYERFDAITARIRFSTSALLHTPQTYDDVLILLAAAQRYCLEACAMLDKVNKWSTLPLDGRDVDHSVMGTVTDQIAVVIEMYEKGVPVWLVRPPNLIPNDINVVQQLKITEPCSRGIVVKHRVGVPIIYQGPLSQDMPLALESWKPGCMDLRLLSCAPDQVVDNALISTETNMETTTNKHSAKPYKKSGKKRRTAASFGVIMARFTQPSSPLALTPLSVWSNALSNVETDISPAVLIESPFSQYAFPDSSALLLEDDEMMLNMIIGWILIRSSWIGELCKMNTRTLPLPPRPQWGWFLRRVAWKVTPLDVRQRIIESSTDRAASTNPQSTNPQSKNPHSRSHSHRRKFRQRGRQTFIPLPDESMAISLSWNNRTIEWKPGDERPQISTLDYKLVIWDIQEHNFRVELLFLDQRVLQDIWNSPSGSDIRERKIRACFLHESVLVSTLPSSPTLSGIASAHWEDRCPYVDAFRDALSDWPGEVPIMLKNLAIRRSDGSWDENVMLQVEEMATKFYCQTFFNYFGRAASIPYPLPT